MGDFGMRSPIPVLRTYDVAATKRFYIDYLGLHAKEYPYLNPGIDDRGVGREVKALDPASNEIRFFEAGTPERETAA
jgi:catechol 2,3-dioxygenase-like lactoylglutathione lyase family enzyme